MKVIMLGKFFQLDEFPMRGIAHTLLREFCRVNHDDLTLEVVCEQYSDRLEEINNKHNLVLIHLDAAYDKEVFQLIKDGKITRKVLGVSTELFDVFYRSSSYRYFNYSISYLKSKMDDYNIWDVLGGTISGSFECLIHPEESSTIPNLYYPYLLAPSVYEDKISYLRKKIKENPVITNDHKESVCMVYKFGNEFREELADKVVKIFPDIHYGGKWRNNDDRVKFDYDFDIINEYYSLFQYNVAVENDYQPGWITEKLINPLLAGSVPIYYAPFDGFPGGLINREAVVVVNEKLLYRDNDLSLLSTEINKDRTGIPIFNENAESTFEKFIENEISMLSKIIKICMM